MSAENLIPEVKAITVGGEQIIVSPFYFGQLPAVSKHIGAVTAAIHIKDGKVQLASLMSDAGEDVLAIAGIACGKPRAWFDTVKSDEGLEVVAAVLAVNLDFFAQKVSPKLADITRLLTAPAPAKA